MQERRAFCSEVSLEAAEPLAATASRVDHWILIEYRGLWSRDALGGSGLSVRVKAHLRERAGARARTKLLFVRRTERRGRRGLAAFWGSTPERGGRFSRAELEGYDDLLELDLCSPGKPVGHPLLLVCTHGKRDRCCARHGRPLYEALHRQADEDWVWQSTHIGGDRFAGNLVVLPEGLYFGRVSPGEAGRVLDAYLAGRVELDRYRGRCCYGFAAQAAERVVREANGLVGIDELWLLTSERLGDVCRVRFRGRGGGDDYALEVVPGRGELTYLTCAATDLRRPRRYAARILPGPAA